MERVNDVVISFMKIRSCVVSYKLRPLFNPHISVVDLNVSYRGSVGIVRKGTAGPGVCHVVVVGACLHGRSIF